MPKKTAKPASKKSGKIVKTSTSSPKKSSSKKSSAKTTQSSSRKLESKIVELYQKNKNLQKEINIAKKKYEALEKESLKLTKELMEAGYIPKELTLDK